MSPKRLLKATASFRSGPSAQSSSGQGDLLLRFLVLYVHSSSASTTNPQVSSVCAAPSLTTLGNHLRSEPLRETPAAAAPRSQRTYQGETSGKQGSVSQGCPQDGARGMRM